MDLQEAIKIMRAFADGLDPETREALPPASVCRKANHVKALNRSVSALIAQQEREQNRPAAAGKYWSTAEDNKICEEIRKGMDLREIAKLHNRTLGSIVVHLVKLGKITPDKTAAKTKQNQAA